MLKKMSSMFVVLLMLVMISPAYTYATGDSVKLPSWASSGNLKTELESKGQKVAQILATVVGILGVLGMLVGAVCFPLNKPEQGKAFVAYSAIGLVVAGSVYGLAKLFI